MTYSQQEERIHNNNEQLYSFGYNEDRKRAYHEWAEANGNRHTIRTENRQLFRRSCPLLPMWSSDNTITTMDRTSSFPISSDYYDGPFNTVRIESILRNFYYHNQFNVDRQTKLNIATNGGNLERFIHVHAGDIAYSLVNHEMIDYQYDEEIFERQISYYGHKVYLRASISNNRVTNRYSTGTVYPIKPMVREPGRAMFLLLQMKRRGDFLDNTAKGELTWHRPVSDDLANTLGRKTYVIE